MGSRAAGAHGTTALESEAGERSRRRPVYDDRPPSVGPALLWRLSRLLYRSGFFRLARVVKGACFLGFRAVLPPEATVGRDLRLEHYALGVVIHPNTVIGDRCRIYHFVTLGSSASIGSSDQIVIGSDVWIGAGATVLNRAGRSLRIGDRSKIGANCLVIDDVPADTVVRAPLGVMVSRSDP